MQWYSAWIIHDATQKIVDALLTLCWCSVDALLTVILGVVTWTLPILTIKVGNTWIIGKCSSITRGLYKIQHWKSYTLCWCSVDTHFEVVATWTLTIMCMQAANSSIMSKCHSTALQLYTIQSQKLFMLRWHSFSECSSDLVGFFFPYTGC